MKKAAPFFAILMFCSLFASGQTSPADKRIIQAVFQDLKQLKTYGYNYIIDAKFPNGKTEQLKGEVYADGIAKTMFNKNPAQVLYYSSQWYYKADLLHQTVTVMDIKKRLGAAAAAQKEENIFGSALMSEFLDSVVQKYGKPVLVKQEGAIAELVFTFNRGASGLRRLEITYDLNAHLPVSLRMQLFYPWQNGAYRNTGTQGTTQTIRCEHYTRQYKGEAMEKYFTLKGGKVLLAKFKNYKLHTYL